MSLLTPYCTHSDVHLAKDIPDCILFDVAYRLFSIPYTPVQASVFGIWPDSPYNTQHFPSLPLFTVLTRPCSTVALAVSAKGAGQNLMALQSTPQHIRLERAGLGKGLLSNLPL